MEVVPRPAGCGDSSLTGGSIPNEAGDAPQVVPGHAHHVDPRVGVIDPVDRDLMDAEAVSFRQDEELRVEEPVIVVHQWEQELCRFAAGRLEPACRIPELVPQGAPQQERCRCREHGFTTSATQDVSARGEAAADRHVAVSREERRHQRQQGPEVSGEIDIHVGTRSGPSWMTRRPVRLAPSPSGQDGGR